MDSKIYGHGYTLCSIRRSCVCVLEIVLAVTSACLRHRVFAISTIYQPFETGYNLSHYCPSMPHCNATGYKHILCDYAPETYFLMDPKCKNPINIRIPDNMVTSMLGATNIMRSRVATGSEERIPRGYGMRRLAWDQQLATFAQIYTNRCSFNFIYNCFATYRFKNPGHMSAIRRFDKNWDGSGFKMEHLLSASYAIFLNWFEQRALVTDKKMVLKHPGDEQRKLSWYLQLIYGPATHMGCGASAYSESDTKDPVEGQPVYLTEHPAGNLAGNYSARCGCPLPETAEDDGCLCYDAQPKKGCAGDCTDKPAVVVLPIVTYDDEDDAYITKKKRKRMKELQFSSLSPSLVSRIGNLSDVTVGSNQQDIQVQPRRKHLEESAPDGKIMSRPVQHRPAATVRHRYFGNDNRPITTNGYHNVRPLLVRRTNQITPRSIWSSKSLKGFANVTPYAQIKSNFFSSATTINIPPESINSNNDETQRGKKQLKPESPTPRTDTNRKNNIMIKPRKDFFQVQNIAKEYQKNINAHNTTIVNEPVFRTDILNQNTKDYDVVPIMKNNHVQAIQITVPVNKDLNTIFNKNQEDFIRQKLIQNSVFANEHKVFEDDEKHFLASNTIEVRLRNQTNIGDYMNDNHKRKLQVNSYPEAEERNSNRAAVTPNHDEVKLNTNENQMVNAKIKHTYAKALGDDRVDKYPDKLRYDYSIIPTDNTETKPEGNQRRRYNGESLIYGNETSDSYNKNDRFESYRSKYLAYRRAKQRRNNYDNKQAFYETERHPNSFRNLKPMNAIERSDVTNDDVNVKMSAKTRQYYRDKLNALERKLHETLERKRVNKEHDDRDVRPVRADQRKDTSRHSKAEEATIWLAEKRARLLHGF